jgi:nucleoside-diphosphate-sugar epimerase
MNILTTGVKSGIGRYLYENFGGIGFSRDSSLEDRQKIRKDGADIIIHCAANSSREITSRNLFEYVNDNIFLTQEMATIPHKKFIFFSSIDVYPKNNINHQEDENIILDEVKGIYGLSKLISESLISRLSKNFLILRCASLLGIYNRRHSLIKLIEDPRPILSLSGDSVLNYVLYSDILDFIKFAVNNNLGGIFNIVSSGNITLFEIAEMLGKKLKFGDYQYNCGNIDNKKVAAVFPSFLKNSKEVVNQFIRI